MHCILYCMLTKDEEGKIAETKWIFRTFSCVKFLYATYVIDRANVNKKTNKHTQSLFLVINILMMTSLVSKTNKQNSGQKKSI